MPRTNAEKAQAWRQLNPEKAITRRYYLKAQKQRSEQAQTRVLKAYGVSDADCARLLQQKTCDICGEAPGKTLDIDHDHATMVFRGMLCRQCNVMLGCAKDDVRRLVKAAFYLTKKGA